MEKLECIKMLTVKMNEDYWILLKQGPIQYIVVDNQLLITFLCGNIGL